MSRPGRLGGIGRLACVRGLGWKRGRGEEVWMANLLGGGEGGYD